MDFAGLDVLLCSDTNTNNNNNNNNNNSAFSFDTNPKSSSSIKHEQSLSITPTTHNQDVKKLCLDDLLQSRSNTCSVFSAADSHNMLSFSSPQCNVTQPFPFYHPRNTSTGYGVRGLFTPSQWMELEHQALIYKYITVNAPIPSNLLIPIRKALETAAFCSFPTNLRHTAYGWGGFHMGFSNNSDPEPGRCRRTDGKKWRCSRDAVADQKYCERHMNRGRHRSRKPVEGQTGANTTVTAAVNAAVVSAPAAAVTTTSSTVNSRLNQHNQHQINRSFLNRGSDKIEDRTGVSMLSNSSIGFTHKPISVSSEFGFVCSDSLLNPLHKNENVGQKSPNSLHQFMDDWPHSDKTQLSISIPMPSSGFISSNSSPIHKKVKFSPLRMGLGVGNTTAAHQVFDEMSQPMNLIPVSWEASSGGPLGEVLNHNASNSPSPLNLMTDGWESSQHTTLSPTGVLQKTGFGCFSSSSAGSSPRTDNSLLGSTSMITSSLPLL